mmetsp:Transcript_22557/g.57305  ORF Transcript_22557/g.57305 Transcript_22557/m.57305 type:complete len:268 (-) Transcript_22557:900-1703(-)
MCTVVPCRKPASFLADRQMTHSCSSSRADAAAAAVSDGEVASGGAVGSMLLLGVGKGLGMTDAAQGGMDRVGDEGLLSPAADAKGLLLLAAGVAVAWGWWEREGRLLVRGRTASWAWPPVAENADARRAANSSSLSPGSADMESAHSSDTTRPCDVPNTGPGSDCADLRCAELWCCRPCVSGPTLGLKLTVPAGTAGYGPLLAAPTGGPTAGEGGGSTTPMPVPPVLLLAGASTEGMTGPVRLHRLMKRANEVAADSVRAAGRRNRQ